MRSHLDRLTTVALILSFSTTFAVANPTPKLPQLVTRQQDHVEVSRCLYVTAVDPKNVAIEIEIVGKSTTETGGRGKGLSDNLKPCGLTPSTQFNPTSVSYATGNLGDYVVDFQIPNSTDVLTCVQNAIWAAEQQHLPCLPISSPIPGVTECAVIDASTASSSYSQNISSDQFLAVVQVHTNQTLYDGTSGSNTAAAQKEFDAMSGSLQPCGIVGTFAPQLTSATDYFARFVVAGNASVCIEHAIAATEGQNVTCLDYWDD